MKSGVLSPGPAAVEAGGPLGLNALLCVSGSPLSVGCFSSAAPAVAPNFTVEDTSADSILVKWDEIPVDELRGFLRGYLFYFEKGERDTSKIIGLESGE